MGFSSRQVRLIQEGFTSRSYAVHFHALYSGRIKGHWKEGVVMNVGWSQRMTVAIWVLTFSVIVLLLAQRGTLTL